MKQGIYGHYSGESQEQSQAKQHNLHCRERTYVVRKGIALLSFSFFCKKVLYKIKTSCYNSKVNPTPGRNTVHFLHGCFLTIVWNGAQYITNGAGKQHILGGFIHVRGQDPDLP